MAKPYDTYKEKKTEFDHLCYLKISPWDKSSWNTLSP